jgi:WD40 repeat protein
MAKFRDHGDDIHCLAFSYDGKVLPTGSADKTIKLWNMIGY